MAILQWILILFGFPLIFSKEDDLPLCPSNMAFFPQNLPMHCRMPKMSDFQNPKFPQMPHMLGNFFKNNGKPPDGQPGSAAADMPMPESLSIPGGMPIPGSGALPGGMSMPGMPIPGLPLPGGMPIPGGMSLPGGMPMPGGMTLPGSMALPGGMPMPIAMPGSPQKLPVIVMPFYSPDPAYKKTRPPHKKSRRPPPKRPRYDIGYSSETDLSSATSSSYERDRWKGIKRGGRRNSRVDQRRKQKSSGKKKQQLLTPMLQYVTKDGYVIFEKQISKGEAKDWLGNKNEGAEDDAIHNDERLEQPEGAREPKVDFDEEEVQPKKKGKEQNNVMTIPKQSKNRLHRKLSVVPDDAKQE